VLLGGDVHNAYIGDVKVIAGQRSRIVQVVCSPFRNPLSAKERRIVRATASAPAARVFQFLARMAGVPAQSADWRLIRRQTFDNSIGELELNERAAQVTLRRSPRGSEAAEQLQTLDTTILSTGTEPR